VSLRPLPFDHSSWATATAWNKDDKK